MSIEEIIKAISGRKISLINEKDTQKSLDDLFIEKNILFTREYRLSEKSIPDFFNEETGTLIEVKLKGNAKSIYKQCERYSEFEKVTSIILITNRTMGWPESINDKPSYIVNLGKAWL